MIDEDFNIWLIECNTNPSIVESAKYLEQLKRDDKKLRFCELNGIQLVEIYPKDVVSVDLFEEFGVIL
jgi:hypothetical protein